MRKCVRQVSVGDGGEKGQHETWDPAGDVSMCLIRTALRVRKCVRERSGGVKVVGESTLGSPG